MMNGDEIKKLRERLQVTQNQFANLLGVHSVTVSNWERGATEPQPYQQGLLESFKKAAAREESGNIGNIIAGTLIGAGIGAALYLILKAAFEEEEE